MGVSIKVNFKGDINLHNFQKTLKSMNYLKIKSATNNVNTQNRTNIKLAYLEFAVHLVYSPDNLCWIHRWMMNDYWVIQSL